MFSFNSRNYELIGEPFHQALHTSGSDEACYKIYGYRNNSKRLFLYHFVSLLLAGIPYVIFSMYPKYCAFKYKNCSLCSAEYILVGTGFGNYFLVPVQVDSLIIPKKGQMFVRYFEFQHSKYVWDSHDVLFIPLDAFVPRETLDELLENHNGLRETEYYHLCKLYGPNKIDVEIKSYWRLFVEEVYNPFYIFQVFSMALWCFDDYISYAVCVFVLTLFSAITSLVQTRKQSVALHDMVVSSTCNSVNVLRQDNFLNNHERTIDPCDLVPGDLIVLPSTGIVMPCDAVLLSGQCIVNESMLTGESVPVTKTPPHSSSTEFYDSSIHKRHTVYCGTHVLQTRYYEGKYVLARVVRTGFNTSKGSLVKSILFPTPVGLQFYKDSLKFVFVLFVIAAFGMGFCLYMYITRHANIKDIIVRTLDIITIVVPPALPAAMTVGTVYSQSRLKAKKIFCISPPRINVCGKVKLACFDKTGTLTEDGLDLHLVIPCENSALQTPLDNPKTLHEKSPLLQAMATCHSLTRIGGEISGDPLDIIMFESTDWDLDEPEVPENAMYDLLAPTVVKPKSSVSFTTSGSGDTELPYNIGIIRQFPFSSTQQCMTVICRELTSSHMVAFTKGAPERVLNMCINDTVPKDFANHLASYTSRGFRVIAVAYKNLPAKFKWKEAQKVKREVIECDLVFVGLLVMQNALKKETAPVIRTLHNANIRTVMITGDNLFTAISVARNCDMVNAQSKVLLVNLETENNSEIPKIFIENVEATDDHSEAIVNLASNKIHFAMDGKTWSKLRAYYSDLIPHLLVHTTIFARFQPDQKTQLISSLQKLDYVVSMVGDGANDCGALKAAHVGISLSQAEASVAAPFTSAIQNISCVIHLMLEGRCALVTSFAVFKYMALYSLIQFITILILYYNHSILGDAQFLFIDLIITTSLAVTIGRQGPANFLVPERPMGSLVSAKNLIPLILQVGLCLLIQLGALFYLFTQSWFEPLPPGKEEVTRCWEDTVLFTVSCYQYIILACVYSKGKPYRERLITNFWFLVSAMSLTTFLTYLVVFPSKQVAEFFEIIYVPHHGAYEQRLFRYCLLLFPVVHFLFAVFIEACMADCQWLKRFVHIVVRKKHPKNKYKLLLEDENFLGNFCRDNVVI